jgi:hypothetical protein
LPAIDEDIALMAKKLEQTQSSAVPQQENMRFAIQKATGRHARPSMVCHHIEPKHFKVGCPLDLELSIEKAIASARLYYRHVNHAERYETVQMQLTGKSYRATILADYTNSQYPLQYYFELRGSEDKVRLYRGFTANLMNQPYFVVRKT